MAAGDQTARYELGTDGPKIIVVGVDGSPTSLRAGSYAAGLARRQGARLEVVHVVATPTLAGLAPYAAGYLNESADEISENVRAQVAEGAAHVGVHAEFRSVRGDPYTELCRIATEIGADAVVVGASAQAGHRLIGSLAVRLVRAGKWPVTVVP
jgi:nucleotide-binding universal stress UspA family protein